MFVSVLVRGAKIFSEVTVMDEEAKRRIAQFRFGVCTV
jgi:hypothetical protein